MTGTDLKKGDEAHAEWGGGKVYLNRLCSIQSTNGPRSAARSLR